MGKPGDEARTALDRAHSAYRFLLADLMPFGRNARITLEHGGQSTSREHDETVTYWYGLDRPTLVLTEDPDCLHNLATDLEHAGVTREHRERLHAFLEETGDPRVLGNGDIWESYERLEGPMREFPAPEWATMHRR